MSRIAARIAACCSSRSSCPRPAVATIVAPSGVVSRSRVSVLDGAPALGSALSWLPLVDAGRRTAHQGGAVAVREAVGDAERLDALLVGQERGRPRPVSAPEA